MALRSSVLSEASEISTTFSLRRPTVRLAVAARYQGEQRQHSDDCHAGLFGVEKIRLPGCRSKK